MKRKQKLSLSVKDAARQREIARYLKRGLPLAGVLAAALFCGCEEEPSGGLSGAVVTAPSVKGEKANPPDNRPNERPGVRLMGEPLPPEDNSGNENKRCRPLSGEPIVLKEKADK